MFLIPTANFTRSRRLIYSNPSSDEYRRTSRLAFCSVFAVVVLINSSNVNADLITFDDLPNDTAVTTQYAGVIFSSTMGFENRTLNDAANYGSSPPNHLVSGVIGGALTGLDETILDFTVPVNNLSFFGTFINGSGEVATIDVFTNSVLASSIGVFGDGNPSSPDNVDLTAFNNVTRIRIHSLSDPGGLGWDDFQFTAVPEPGSLLVVSLGIGIIACRSSRRRSNTTRLTSP